MLFSLLVATVATLSTCNGILWEGDYWSIACNFPGNDLANIRSSIQDCEGQCASTYGCTHFTWTKFNGGTCWMKQNNISKLDAIESNDLTCLCGILESVLSLSTVNNVKATRHGAHEHGACALPSAKYDVWYPVALGDIGELQNLKFRPELCGHVLNVDCGHGKLDIVINNSNLGGGLDLYGSTWDLLTNHQAPGITHCSVELSSRNAISGAGYVCYYKPGTDHTNRWYHNVGLLNTNNKLVTGAVIGNKVGGHRGASPYFAFDGEVDDNDQVTFSLNDGSKKSVRLKECVYLDDEQMWS